MDRTEEIKSIIIDCLGLEDVSISDIDSDAPLFGEGLSLDSIDALEIGIAISKKYDVVLDPNSENMKEHFHSVSSLNNYIQKTISNK